MCASTACRWFRGVNCPNGRCSTIYTCECRGSYNELCSPFVFCREEQCNAAWPEERCPGLNQPLIIALFVCLGVSLLILFAVLIAFFVRRRARKRKAGGNQSAPPTPQPSGVVVEDDNDDDSQHTYANEEGTKENEYEEV